MNLFFITEQIPMFNAFRQVIEALCDSSVSLVTQGNNLSELMDTHDIVIIEGNDQTISRWLWDNIRIKYLNPVIALGSSAGKNFLKNNPVFSKGMSQYHRYFEPPWLLYDLFNAMEQMTPLHDDATRQIVYDRYGTPYVEDRIYRLIDHDLKLFDRQKDIAVLEEALKYANELNVGTLQEKLMQAIQLRQSDDIGALQQIKSEVLLILKEGLDK